MESTLNTRPQPTAEKIYFQAGNVKVTNARLVVASQTYPIVNIASIAHNEQAPKRWYGILLAIVGLYCLIWNMFTIGVTVIIVGALWAWFAKGLYSVTLRTGSGETRALATSDRPFVKAVADALNESIIGRG